MSGVSCHLSPFYFLVFCFFFLLRFSLSLNLETKISTGLAGQEPRVSSCLCVPRAEITGVSCRAPRLKFLKHGYTSLTEPSHIVS